MRVAIVHEWFVDYSGSEKVLEQILNIYPEADLYALVDFLPNDLRWFIKNKKVYTSFIQNLPFAKSKFRHYLPLFSLAIEQLDLGKYDIVISNNHCVAKNVITNPDQLHISYVHSPIRYAWDKQNQYLKESNLDKGIKGFITKLILQYARINDIRGVNGVDEFICNSHYISRRIWKNYKRKAKVIYPPVDIDTFQLNEKKEDYYFTASRMVPYKRMDLIVEAFQYLPDKKLVVIGDGPEFPKVKQKAGKNVELLGFKSTDVLKKYMSQAKAFIFAAEEDFGIIPVEAQACGTPVIAYGKGGALETIINNETGLFFYEQSVEAIVSAVKLFERESSKFIPKNIRLNSEKFSVKRFQTEFKDYVDSIINKYLLKED